MTPFSLARIVFAEFGSLVCRARPAAVGERVRVHAELFGHPLPNPDASGPRCEHCGHLGDEHGHTYLTSPCDVANCECLDGKWVRSTQISAAGATVADSSGAGVDCPAPVSEPPIVVDGVPTFAVLHQLLTNYAEEHGELRFDGAADHWSCQCGRELPDHPAGAYAALRVHCVDLQTSALSFVIAEARHK